MGSWKITSRSWEIAKVIFAQSLEDKNYCLCPAERYFPYSGCAVQVGSQCVSGACRMPLPEEQCRAPAHDPASRRSWHCTSGSVTLCVFWAAMLPAGSSRALWQCTAAAQLLSLAGRVRAPPNPFSFFLPCRASVLHLCLPL